ncbi:MAG: hypothetical protein QOF99_8558 [Pseudonocardiales bacterium]|nr:hypothetical protein [Pseudonocardiales bacterium]
MTMTDGQAVGGHADLHGEHGAHPDRIFVEHFTDGDMFDNTLEPGWAPFTRSGLAQWGPPATSDFLGTTPGPDSLKELRAVVSALRGDNEFDVQRLRGLLKGARS